MKSTVTKSKVNRPYVISVEADVPSGAMVRIDAKGDLPGGAEWRKDYVNPSKSPLPTPHNVQFDLHISPVPNSLTSPFVYAVAVEGDFNKWSFDALEIAKDTDLFKMGWVLVTPKEGRPYITVRFFEMSIVTSSEIQRPWLLSADCDTPGGTEVLITMSGMGEISNNIKNTYNTPKRQPIPIIEPSTIQWGITLNAPVENSSEPFSRYTPFFRGLTIEGDNRQFYIKVKDLVGTNLPDSLMLLNLNNDESALILKPAEPLGPPDALLRLIEMFEAGLLKPER